jgi:aminopeptidase N
MIKYLLLAVAIFSGHEVVAEETLSITTHNVKARLVPETGEIQYTDQITIKNKSEFRFRLAPWLSIKNVLVNDITTVPLRMPAGWLVSLPEADINTIQFSISGSIPPLTARTSDAGSGAAWAGKEGVFLPGYKAWLPDSGESPVAYSVHATVPKPYRIVGTGLTQDKASNISLLSADKAIELPSLFVGPYQVTEKVNKDIRLRTYFHKGLEALAHGYLKKSEKYIRRYSKKIGPYPYSDFHVVSAPMPVGLGFPNLTYVGRRVLALPFMQGRSLAHEVLHNWWGNGIAIGYDEGNWAEGLTTFMADYALAEDKGADAAREMRLGWLRDFSALPRERDIPVTQFYGKRHDASQVIGYGKIASIFYMLRANVGRDIFDSSLQLFWSRHKFSTARWSDIKTVFEETSGRRLGWFFDQWLEKPGAPSLTLKSVTHSKRNGQYQVSITVTQQKPFYELDVPIRISISNHAVEKRLKIKGGRISATYQLEAKPYAVLIDPDFKLFRRLLPSESPPILRDVTLASGVAVMLATDNAEMKAAATELARRLLDVRGQRPTRDLSQLRGNPALIIGSEAKILKIINQIKWLNEFSYPLEQGTTSAWVRRRADGYPVLIIKTKDAASLTKVLSALPHYRSRSFIVFKGRHAIAKGVWGNTSGPLTKKHEK